MKFLTILIAVLLLMQPGLAKSYVNDSNGWIEIPVDSKHIIGQGLDFTCGYASILNALRFGSLADEHVFNLLPGKSDQERIKYLISKYGSKPSKEFKNNQRQGNSGIGCEDLCEVYKEMRIAHSLPQMGGVYVDRQNGESPQEQLERIHRLFAQSLIQGEPPIIFLCSEVMEWRPTFYDIIRKTVDQKDHMDNAAFWHLLTGHTVTVVGIPKTQNADGSFAINYLNPATGRKDQLLLYSNVRNVPAYKGGHEKLEWLPDRPFLSTSGGSLLLLTQTQPWSARTEIYLYYAIYRK